MSNEDKKIPKGFLLEELLRAYFLRAGFFVIRGVPFRFIDEDLTDVDLWLYERPTGTSRRVQICDIKYKQRPKAVERIFWTKGLAEALNVDGAYVATTDKRRSLRSVAKKLDIQLIDGSDIDRIQSSHQILFSHRIAGEDLLAELQAIDKDSKNKKLQEARTEILTSLADGFGAPSVVRALSAFKKLASAVSIYPPNSSAARAAGRLAYLSAAIACISLDFVSIEAAFRPIEERRELLLKAVRLGALSNESGQKALILALALVEKYAPAGRATAIAVETGLHNDLNLIPAEIIADQAVNLIKADQLFSVGRELEEASHSVDLPSFDDLSIPAKSMLGAFLDYTGGDREHFANAWRAIIK